MKKIFIIIISLFVTLSGFSQYENADAVYNKIIKEYTLHENGSISLHYTKDQTLLSYRAFNSLYGETFIVYNPDFQNLKINEAYTIMADGKHVKTPENAFNEVLPSMASHAPAYNHLREMVVTHTGLERQASIHLDYTITSKKGYLPFLMDDVLIPTESPIKDYVLIVKVPVDIRLNYKTLNIRTSPEITPLDNYVSYMWHFRELDAVNPEAFMPDNNAHLPRVIFSTAKNMKQAYQWFVKNKAFDTEITEDMGKKVFQTATSRADEVANAVNLQKMVVSDLNNYRVLPQDFGFKFRNPVQVWKSNGGSELEKAVLLSAMMKKSGLIAKPVAIINNRLYDEKIGCLTLLDKFMVQVVPKNNEHFYLSVNHTDAVNQKYYLKDKKILILDPASEIPEIITENQGENIIAVSGELLIEDLSLSGEMNTLFSGHFNPYINIHDDNKKAERYIRGTDVKSVSVVKGNELRNELKYEIEDDKAFTEKAGYYYLNIPKASNGIDSWRFTNLFEDRQNPIDLPSSVDESYDFTIDLPEGLNMLSALAEINIENKAGLLKLSITQSGQKLHIQKSIKIDNGYMAVTVYNDFKELMQNWQNPKYSELIFKK